MRSPLLLGLLLLLAVRSVWAQRVPFDSVAVTEPGRAAAAMRALAVNTSSRYRESDREAYLANLMQLQLVAGEYAKAQGTLEAWQALRGNAGLAPPPEPSIAVQLYARAKADETVRHESFASAFEAEFRRAASRMDDRTALNATWSLQTLPSVVEHRFEEALSREHGSKSLTVPAALELVRAYLSAQAFQSFGALIDALVAEDDARRYLIDANVLIKTPQGATLSAIVVRSRGQSGREPTALFSMDQTSTRVELYLSRYAAARGYVGVFSDSRGKRLSPDPIVLYEDDAQDLYWVIDWISRQPWSDGQVGMWGGSRAGFSQWAAAKTLHPALKTIVPECPENPGDGLPMENNVFQTANYAYPFYVADTKYLDDKLYDDGARWNELPWKWYRSGRPYREIDRIDGKPNPWLQRWLRHPSYDAYWQHMTAYGADFARLNIPVLAIDGYYDDGQNYALLNLIEHYRHNPHAEHYLLIGPYDHFGTQSTVKPHELRGYVIDPVAQFDTRALTFEWFDHVMRGGPRPALLQDRINYEVMGANVWEHAPSLEKAHTEVLALYLSNGRKGEYLALTPDKPRAPASLKQTVDLADRSTVSFSTYPEQILSETLNRHSGFAFATAPFEEPVAVVGMFSADLELIANKRDLDIALALYEITPQGRFFHLADTVQRASYARDTTERHLLEPGKLESIPIDRTLFVARQLQRGSRLLLVLDVNKGPWAQVNYGTGKDVSDESFADARVPLRVEWRNESVLRVPIQRDGVGASGQ
jgi:uncharacterized protein